MTYDLEPIHTPRMAGASLRLLIALIESGLTRWALLPTLMKSAGMPKLRQAQLTEVPSVRPPIPGRGALDGGEAVEIDLVPVLDSARKPADCPFETVADFAAAYRDGTTTPEQVARKLADALAATDELDPPMRTMIAWDEGDLLQQAQESTARFAAGAPLGPLDGVPIIVKDELDQVPYRTTVGTRFLGTAPAEEDATVVARLRAAGALLPGKANMHEVGLGVTGLNLNHGTPRNAYDPGHHTGGSSSGAAAAAASGLCPVAVGADGGGSIRIPASLNGMVGLKATFGRISEHGAAPLCWSVAHVGPIGATATDVALAYAAMAGPDQADPGTASQPAPDLEGYLDDDLQGLRIGIYEPWFEDAEPDIVAACRAVVDGFVERGATTVAIDIEELDLTRIAHTITIVSEMLTSLSDHLDAHRHEMGTDVRSNLSLAAALTAQDYVRAQRMRTRVWNRFERIYRDVDIIATPTNGIVAPAIAPDALKAGESNLPMLSALMRFIIPANLIGLPAITFPAGFDSQGLPIGFHAMGRAWEEALLLRLARISEQFVARRPPKVHFPLMGG